MKKLYIIGLLLSFNVVSAQLSVRNSAYIFATDEIVYVEDDVNLNEVDSKVYLRNEAQLIQGSGTTGNSGVGQLSVQQNGTVDNFEYNYWCSPIGNNSAALGNEIFRANLIDESTGLINSTDAAFTNGYDGTSSPLTISNYWLYTFINSNAYSHWAHVGATGNIASGLGFTMKGTSGSASNQLYDFRGKANNGTITNSVAVGQWTLVGNPYPSALDAVDYIHDSSNASNITGTLYYWDQDGSVNSHYISAYQGGYATYTIDASGSVETYVPATFDTYNGDGSLNTISGGGANSNGKVAKRYIPIGQGFMVEGAVAGTVRTTNTMRNFIQSTDTNSSSFFRTQSNHDRSTNNSNDDYIISYTDEGFAIVPDDFKRFRINVDFNEIYTRQLVQTFHSTATDGFDYGLESKSPAQINSGDASWILNNDRYSAQAFTFSQDLAIPLLINVGSQQMIRIRAFDIQNFNNNSQPIYLHDKETNLYVDLQDQNFTANLPSGNYTDRFEITFTNGTLNTEDFVDGSLVIFQNNESNQLFIKNPKLLNIKSVKLYDTLGKRVISVDGVGNESEYKISTANLSHGMYITELIVEDKAIITKKIIVSN